MISSNTDIIFDIIDTENCYHTWCWLDIVYDIILVLWYHTSHGPGKIIITSGILTPPTSRTILAYTCIYYGNMLIYHAIWCQTISWPILGYPSTWYVSSDIMTYHLESCTPGLWRYVPVRTGTYSLVLLSVHTSTYWYVLLVICQSR